MFYAGTRARWLLLTCFHCLRLSVVTIGCHGYHSLLVLHHVGPVVPVNIVTVRHYPDHPLASPHTGHGYLLGALAPVAAAVDAVAHAGQVPGVPCLAPVHAPLLAAVLHHVPTPVVAAVLISPDPVLTVHNVPRLRVQQLVLDPGNTRCNGQWSVPGSVILLGHRDGEGEEEEDQQEGDQAEGAGDDVHLGLERHAAALQ